MTTRRPTQRSVRSRSGDATIRAAWTSAPRSPRLLLTLVLPALNTFFVAAEFALARVRVTGLDELAAAGSGRARLGKHISDHLDEYLSACQVGVTGAWPAVGIAGEPAIATLIEPLFGWLRERAEPAFHVLSFTTAFAPITYLHVVVGERAPKYFAIQRPLPTILWAAPPLHVFSRLMRPFVAVVNASANRILRGFGITRGTSSTPAARKS